MASYKSHQPDIDARLKRIEGQVRGIQKMVAEERYCIDVLTQVNAVKAALEQVALVLLEDHMRTCVSDAILGGDGDEKIEELTRTVERFVRG